MCINQCNSLLLKKHYAVLTFQHPILAAAACLFSYNTDTSSTRMSYCTIRKKRPKKQTSTKIPLIQFKEGKLVGNWSKCYYKALSLQPKYRPDPYKEGSPLGYASGNLFKVLKEWSLQLIMQEHASSSVQKSPI